MISHPSLGIYTLLTNLLFFNIIINEFIIFAYFTLFVIYCHYCHLFSMPYSILIDIDFTNISSLQFAAYIAKYYQVR